ncbi:E3 ubiquitin-protein ligase RNF14-like [Hippocampus comes]|uniref:RBR-type E3 ubiquitin transferase n=1 Tax=Hippocampus comes TaxID=109280 RepID=A0A3Q2Z9E4_HIPCM|nr:PREDICTED: E3 ubiquitin-protein ligase RNF14-like [Hippocampus comes]
MDTEEQENELVALQSIFSSEEFARHESKSSGELRVSVELPSGYAVTLAEDDALKQCKISFLPPLRLNFGLPEDYPSRSPPSFSLSCNWLTHNQLAALGAHLTDLYRATGGDVVLFSWVQFLREDTLAFLNLNSVLVLPNVPSTPYNSQESIHAALSERKSSQTALTSGAENVQTFFLDDEKRVKGAGDNAPETFEERGPFSGLSLNPAQRLLSEILTHDAAQGQKVFQSTVYDCAVCFMSYLGSECVQIQECGHVFCQACLAEFCKLQIREGNVLGVTCAQADCTALPTQAQVESLVGEELFRRYDRLLLQHSLDCMPDVMYCPRPSCASPVVREEASGVALCSVCGFAFCVTCKKTYHGTDDCRPKRLLKSLQKEDSEQGNAELPQSVEGMKALWDDFASGSKQRRRLLVSRYGQKGLFQSLEDCLSQGWIGSNSKNCPRCFCRIEKNFGCNIMTCSQCRQQFCWVCLAVLSYEKSLQHFQDSSCSRY